MKVYHLLRRRQEALGRRKKPFSKPGSRRFGADSISRFVTLFILFWGPSAGFLVWPTATAAADSQNIVPIDDLLDSVPVIAGGNRDKLNRLIDSYLKQDTDPVRLENLVNKIQAKIEKDRKMLHILILDLQRLVKNDFSYKTGRMTHGDISAFWGMDQDLGSEIKHSLYLREVKHGKFDESEYKRMVRLSADILVKDGSGIPRLWDGISSKARASYPRWNKAYHEFTQKIEEAGRRGKSKINLLSYDEENFVEIFKRTQYYLRRLSEAGAKTF